MTSIGQRYARYSSVGAFRNRPRLLAIAAIMVACRTVVYAILALSGEDIPPVSFVIEGTLIVLFAWLWTRERRRPHATPPPGQHERALGFLGRAERVVPPVAIAIAVGLAIVDVLIRINGDAVGSLIWVGQLATTILVVLYLSLLIPARIVYGHASEWQSD